MAIIVHIILRTKGIFIDGESPRSKNAKTVVSFIEIRCRGCYVFDERSPDVFDTVVRLANLLVVWFG